jgi:hypothetical protein
MEIMRARSLFVLAAVLAAVAFGWWFLNPGPLRFRSFDPVLVGRAEAALWRDYYEGKPLELITGLALNNHRAFGFSPLASVRTGLAAADAARRFQRSRSRTGAQAALPPLTEHYRLLKEAARLQIDPAEAARLELEWWQLRRETQGTSYTPAVAAAAAYVYGVRPQRLSEYARLRVAAMNMRDRKGRRISEADWREIEGLLVQAYRALRTEVAQGPQ